jgi:hypothetical protein
MGASLVHFSSLEAVADRVIDHVRREHDTALVGSPGCGISTFVTDLAAEITSLGFRINRFDARKRALPELIAELEIARTAGAVQQVVILDHVADLPSEQFQRLIVATAEAKSKNRDIFVWCGAVDARKASLCSVPSAHVTFPVLSRHELLAVYKHIAENAGCRWGDAILYLILDLCGTDLLLVRSITDYLPGDWSDRLYDDTVWDRVAEWLEQDETVGAYRSRIASLSKCCEDTFALIRFGGKPICKRPELIEESDDGLRLLSLSGFLAPNLLPGFYQPRNLVVRLLLDESAKPEALLRRATNERASALLQDAETMLRQVLASVFGVIGLDSAKARLEKMQQPGEIIEEKLNGAILKWSRANNSEAAHRALVEILNEHREAFRNANSVWDIVCKMMRRDNVVDSGQPHLHCIDYLTLDQLGTLVIGLMDHGFPRLTKEIEKKRVRDGWQEAVAKVGRLRNQVAHLRNVSFQDMEDLARTLERMRRDVIDYGGWKLPPTIAAAPTEQTATRESE